MAGDRLNLEIVEGAKGELRHWTNDVFRLYLDATNPGPYFASFDTTGLSITGLGTFERLQ